MTQELGTTRAGRVQRKGAGGSKTLGMRRGEDCEGGGEIYEIGCRRTQESGRAQGGKTKRYEPGDRKTLGA